MLEFGLILYMQTNEAFEKHDAKARRNFFRFERWNFRIIHGYKLNLDSPQSFSEKIVWKKIFDRNPLMPIVADKFKVRDYVTDRLGKRIAKEILIPLLWCGDNPENIPFEELQDKFVVKANHGSRMNIIVKNNNSIAQSEIIASAKKWLEKDFGYRRNEWCYQPIERKIVIESLLEDANGDIPSDVKLYMFDGKLGMIEIIADRFNSRSVTYYDENLNRVEMSNGGKPNTSNKLPENIKEMIEIAQKLSVDFDHIRVDLYDLNGTVKFGELTNYNASGRVAIKPTAEDFKLGQKWTLNKQYARKI